jgi:hypothetical protein
MSASNKTWRVVRVCVCGGGGGGFVVFFYGLSWVCGPSEIVNEVRNKPNISVCIWCRCKHVVRGFIFGKDFSYKLHVQSLKQEIIKNVIKQQSEFRGENLLKSIEFGLIVR